MSIKILSRDLSNGRNHSYWNFSSTPYPIFRVGNRVNNLTLPVGQNYQSGSLSRVIITEAKKTTLLVQVDNPEKDEKIALISFTGQHRGEIPCVVVRGVKVLKDKVGIFNENPFVFMVSRFPKEDNGEYIAISTDNGQYSVFYYDKVVQMTCQEYDKFAVMRDKIIKAAAEKVAEVEKQKHRKKATAPVEEEKEETLPNAEITDEVSVE